jgi:transcriptional regulator with XRE-family HTH domain
MPRTELGEFLRTRRAGRTPEDVGLSSAVGGPRRVPGLRREEVALLAGVSVDYYTRLEQGRERTPSAQMLSALGAALRLDDDGLAHLYRLAGRAPRASAARVPDHVHPDLLRLMAAWPDNPALVYNRAYDVLAANPIAEALFGAFAFSRNLMLLVFFDPDARDFYTDWRAIAENAVAGFRLAHGTAPDDPRVRAVLAQLLEHSGEFRDMWANHDARGKALATKTFSHSDVGVIELSMQTFDVRAAPGQELVVYQAEPESASADRLALLGSLAVSPDRTQSG